MDINTHIKDKNNNDINETNIQCLEQNKIEDKEITNNKTCKKDRKITCYKLIVNTILSLLLIVFFIVIPQTYDDRHWRMFFFMTLWSFTMNTFYIVSITIIDWIRFIKKNNNLCYCYNDFVRNLYLKISFPFAIAIVFLYWMLILLGDDFEYRGRDVTDTASGVFFHGIILIFLLFDMFTDVHVNKINYFWDLIIITILIFIYYIILGVGKYAIDYEPYDFMEISSVRQIVGACILIFIAILDGYVISNLLANKFFLQFEEKNLNGNVENKTKPSSEVENLSNFDINTTAINSLYNKTKYKSQKNIKVNNLNYEKPFDRNNVYKIN